MKETSNLCALWKRDVQWERMTTRQKLISVWFSVSFIMVALFADSVPMTVLSLANFAASIYCCARYVPMREE